jgi:hypothetical protein
MSASGNLPYAACSHLAAAAAAGATRGLKPAAAELRNGLKILILCPACLLIPSFVYLLTYSKYAA